MSKKSKFAFALGALCLLCVMFTAYTIFGWFFPPFFNNGFFKSVAAFSLMYGVMEVGKLV